jgi:hypothetical protein
MMERQVLELKLHTHAVAFRVIGTCPLAKLLEE